MNDITFDLLLVAQTQAGTVGRGVSGAQWIAIAIALAVLILPFVAGSYFAKWFKMPTYGTRFGWILLALVASIVVLSNRWPGLGIDLRGGTILVYEMEPGKIDGPEQVTSQDLIEPLTRRINPSGTQEIVIRPYGEKQIEIIVPEVDQREVDRIKRKVEEAGILRFAIVANQADHQAEFNLAMEQAESPDPGIRTREIVLDSTGRQQALWVEIDREVVDGAKGPLRYDPSSGGILRDPRTGRRLTLPPEVLGGDTTQLIANWIDREEMPGIEILMKYDEQLDITGEDLAFASSTFDESGAPAVAFHSVRSGFRSIFRANAKQFTGRFEGPSAGHHTRR